MKRTRIWLVAVGLACTPLVACNDYRSTDMTLNSHVEVAGAGGMRTDTNMGAIRLGDGDKVGNMLQDYYLVHFQGQRETIVQHGPLSPVDPSP